MSSGASLRKPSADAVAGNGNGKDSTGGVDHSPGVVDHVSEGETDTRRDDDLNDKDIASNSNPFFLQNIHIPEPPCEDLHHGELSLCEFNCELFTVSSPNDPTLRRYKDQDGVFYPRLWVPVVDEGLGRVTSIVKHTKEQQQQQQQSLAQRGRELLLTSQHLLSYIGLFDSPHDQVTPYAEGGTTVSGKTGDDDADDQALVSWKRWVLALLDGIGLTVLLPVVESRAVAPYCLARSRWGVDRASAIRGLAWHRCQQRLCVALRNDSVYLFDMNTMEWGPFSLKHANQVDISSVSWRPLSSNTIAVACRGCVCLWEIPRPQSALRHRAASARLESASATVVLLPNADGALSSASVMEWSPCGRYLAVGSPDQPQIHIWDVAFPSNPSLCLLGRGGTSVLSWSPDGRMLFSSHVGSTFRVWDTDTWECQRWYKLPGVCHCCVWSPDGKVLLLASRGSSVIHSIQFDGLPTKKSSGGRPSICEDLSKFSTRLPLSGELATVCGEIRHMAWDPLGERLVVSFDGGNEADGGDAGTGLLAAFSTRHSPSLYFAPLGFIRGPINAGLTASLQFRYEYERGALLCVAWTSGEISFFPFYFSC